MAEKRIRTYAEFWPYYLREHANQQTKVWHAIGTLLVVAALAGALVFQCAWLLVLVPFLGYGPAWYSHFFIEKNRPATFRYPLWSLISDFRMAYLFLLHRL